MRKLILIFIIMVLNVNVAFAIPKQSINVSKEQDIIDVIKVLTRSSAKTERFKNKLYYMNYALRGAEAKFEIEEMQQYIKNQIQGRRYLLKNISNKSIFLAKELGGWQILALVLEKNILAPNESAIAYVVKENNA